MPQIPVVFTLAQAPNFFERFNVGRILEPAGALRFDEVVDPDQGNADAGDSDGIADPRCNRWLLRLARA